MRFFCVSCQKKYDIGDIGIDMLSIIKEELGSNLQNAYNGKAPKGIFQNLGNMKLGEEAKEKITEFHGGLKKFVEETARPRDFYIKGSEVKKILKDPQESGSVISGYYQITLKDLAEKYIAANPKEKANFSKYIQLLGAEVGKDCVYSRKMNFNYAVHKTGNYRVLTEVYDEHHVAFETQEGEKLGRRRICPYCGRRLSSVVGLAPEIIVGLIGSPRAGKTSCMTAVAATLYNGSYSKYGMSIDSYIGDASWQQLLEEIEKYNAGIKITKTPDGNNQVPSYSFMISFGRDAHKRKCVLTFIDMPGEFWQKDGGGMTKEYYEKYSQLYNNIDCVWSIISKLSVNEVDLNGDGELAKRIREETSEDAEIVNNSSYVYLRDNFRNLSEHLKRNKIPPTVVIISKTDCAIYEELDQKEARDYRLFPIETDVRDKNMHDVQLILKHEDEDVVLNEKEFFEFGKDARAFIAKKNPSLLQAIEEYCPDRFYVSMAAYGRKADEDPMKNVNTSGMSKKQAAERRRELYSGRKKPTPYHEIFPLLWTLSITGQLKLQHLCEHRKLGLFGGTSSVTRSSRRGYFDYRDELDGIKEDINYNLMMHGNAAELYKISKI